MSLWLMEHSFGLSHFPAAGLFITEGVCLSGKPQPNHLGHVLCSYCMISCARCCFLGLMTLCLLHSIHIIFQLSPSVCFFLLLCLCVCIDIGSWLQLFGFQLHNVVPGFPKPEVSRLEQTYELMKTQTKTQNWDSSKVSITDGFFFVCFFTPYDIFQHRYEH